MSSDSGSETEGEGRDMNRRRFIQGGAVGAAAVAAMGLPQLAGVASAQGGGQPMTITVANSTITFVGLIDDPVAYFIVVGDVDSVDGETVTGKFFCRGVLFDEGAVDATAGAVSFVDQRFRIDGVGTIQGAGAEGDDDDQPLAIVGGTGRFVGAHGTYAQSGGTAPVPLGGGNLEFEFHIRRG